MSWMCRTVLLSLGMGLVLLLVGCGGGSDGPPAAQLLSTTTATIPTTGGVVASPTALGVEAQFTDGALPTSTTVTLNVYDAQGLPINDPNQQAASNTVALAGLEALTPGGSVTITAPMTLPTDEESGYVVMSDGGTRYNVFIPTFDADTQRFTFTVTAEDVAVFTRGEDARVARDWRWRLQHYAISVQQPGANINRFIATTQPPAVSWSAWQEQTATEDWSGERVAVILHGIFHDLSDMNELAWFLKHLPLDPANPNGPRRYTRIYGIDYRWQAGIDTNAEIVADDLAANQATDLDVYGYSMGGLVARWAIEKCGAGHRVKRLFTLGTPHEGVPLRGLALLISPGGVVGVYLTMPGMNDLAQGGRFLNQLNDNVDISGSNSTTYYTFAGTAYETFRGWVGGAMGTLYALMGIDGLDGIVPVSSAQYIGLSRKCEAHILVTPRYHIDHDGMAGTYSNQQFNLYQPLRGQILGTGDIGAEIE